MEQQQPLPQQLTLNKTPSSIKKKPTIKLESRKTTISLPQMKSPRQSMRIQAVAPQTQAVAPQAAEPQTQAVALQTQAVAPQAAAPQTQAVAPQAAAPQTQAVAPQAAALQTLAVAPQPSRSKSKQSTRQKTPKSRKKTIRFGTTILQDPNAQSLGELADKIQALLNPKKTEQPKTSFIERRSSTTNKQNYSLGTLDPSTIENIINSNLQMEEIDFDSPLAILDYADELVNDKEAQAKFIEEYNTTLKELGVKLN